MKTTEAERTAGDREALRLVFDCLDEESREVVFAVRGDGLTWADIAREREITVEHARYVYTMAVTEMEAALARADSSTNTPRFVPFSVLLAQVFEAVRAEVDEAPPELDRQVREGLSRFMEAAGAGAPDPELAPASGPLSPGASIQITTPALPSFPVVPALGLVGGGIAIGIVIGYLLHGALSARPSHEPGRAHESRG